MLVCLSMCVCYTLCVTKNLFVPRKQTILDCIGCPKKSIPKIKVYYKKSWSGIKSKTYCLNTLEGLDLIL